MHNAIKLLQLLVYSKRPLHLEEVVDAVATEPDVEPPFAIENRIDPRIYNNGEIEHCPPTFALYFASQGGLCRTVKHLLEAGADANGAGGRHGNSLQAACRSGSMGTVRVLLDHGANISPEDGDQRALHVAASTGNTEMLRVLLENGADVNAADRVSRTALYQASKNCHVEALQMLLRHGADVNLSSIYGTALQIACGGTRGFICLEAHGSPEQMIIRMLLDHGADVNGHVRGSTPAFTHVCASGHVEDVQLLLDHGANINAEDGVYGTAVCAAAQHGRKEVVQMLLD